MPRVGRGERRRHDEDAGDSLRNLLHLGGVNHTTLRAIINRCNSVSLGKDRVRNADRNKWNLVKTSLPVVLTDGTTFTWEFCDPGKLVVAMVHDCPQLLDIFATALSLSVP